MPLPDSGVLIVSSMASTACSFAVSDLHPGPHPGDAVLDVGLGLADDGVEVGRADDRVVVGADVAAVVGEHLRLVREARRARSVKLVYCAYFAAICSVTFSPPPAIHSGRPPSCNGFGATIAPST